MTHHKLDRDDIQGLLAAGYGNMPEAEFLLLEVKHAAQARAYLGKLADRVAPVGKAAPKDVARHVAFTYQGLQALEVPASACETFSREFKEGMDDAVRSKGLGDEGVNHPRGWAWGRMHGRTPSTPAAHVLLLLYAAPGGLSKLLDDELREMGDAFVVVPKHTKSWDDKKEHFGWADGLSNPTVEGLGKQDRTAWTDVVDEHGVRKPKPVRTGEFVLGYQNEYEQYNESPTADPADDPHGRLPPIADSDKRDLGRNGTYLVYREMAQYVRRLWRYLGTHSQEQPELPVECRATALGAKMVGRWPHGAPVMESTFDDPDHDKSTSNGFRFWDDPDGIGCPLGAHIRRANPRDRMPPDRKQPDSIAMIRKHQLLRRGRAFGDRFVPDLDPAKILERIARDDAAGPPDKDDADRDLKEPRGLHFICLVSHLNRQFEMVQRNWIASPNFAALSKDGDPLIGVRFTAEQENQSDQFTCHAEPVRRRYQDLTQFTQLVGGAYFFLPGINALRFIARS